MYFAAGQAELIYALHGRDCEITAACDGDHNPKSLHPFGLAIDIHNIGLTDTEHADVYAKLRHLDLYGFDIVDEHEGQTSKTTAAHFHIEWQPKAGERPQIFI